MTHCPASKQHHWECVWCVLWHRVYRCGWCGAIRHEDARICHTATPTDDRTVARPHRRANRQMEGGPVNHGSPAICTH